MVLAAHETVRRNRVGREYHRHLRLTWKYKVNLDGRIVVPFGVEVNRLRALTGLAAEASAAWGNKTGKRRRSTFHLWRFGMLSGSVTGSHNLLEPDFTTT